MTKKKKSKIGKVGQTILFSVLTIGSVILIIGFWDFLFAASFGEENSRFSRNVILLICLIPAGFIYLALLPWIKFNGFKGEITGGQLMSIDDEGNYLGLIKDFELRDAKTMARIFERESEYLHEEFHFSNHAFYIKTAKGGQWFFPDRFDEKLIITGEPGAIGIPTGFRISEEQSLIVKQILERYL